MTSWSANSAASPTWAVFIIKDRLSAHVAPALGDEIAHGHVLSPMCWCQPENMTRDEAWIYGPMWSHRDAHWPGSTDLPN